MTNRISERVEGAIALRQHPNETDFCPVDATMGNIEWTTQKPHILKALDESIAEFGRLYAELAKCQES